MKRLALFAVLILALATGWFFISPLFIDRTVDEEFEIVLADGQLDMDALMSMSETERQSMRQEIMDAAAAAPDTSAGDTMPVSAPKIVAQGRFVDADAIHKGDGSAALYELPDGKHVVRFEDFRTTNGPALVVYLAKHPAPATAAQVADNGFLELGKLKGNVGNQNYIVPDGANIDEYNSVVIWCELFGVLFSPAALTRTPKGERDGQVRTLTGGGLVAWDSEGQRWLDTEDFWESFAARGDGRRWPSGPAYPPYAQVSEHDTFLVQTEKGPCLMYFFHTRWRRANDVWRWGDEFNRYGGCPEVFD